MFGRHLPSFRNIFQSTDPVDCFKLQFKALKLMGTFQDPSMNVVLKLLLFSPSLLVLLLCVTSSIYLFANGVALDDKLKGLFAGITTLLCCIKLYFIRRHQVPVINVVNALKNRVNDMNDDETKILYTEAMYPTIVGYLILQFAAFISCTIYCLFPVGKSTYDRPLPIHAWYPHYFNDDKPYMCFYVLQYLSIVFASAIWICVDTINFGLLAHHHVMLKILGERIAKLGWTDKSTRSIQYGDYYEPICEFVKYHIQISSYQSETNQIYGSIMFAKISLSVIIVCSFIYALGLQTENYGRFTAQMIILMVIVLSLLMVTWMSDQISASSNNLLNKVVECNFQCMNRKTTKALLIFMQGVSNTVYIDVGSPFKVTMNLKMFVTIMEYAYKCLTLLKTAT